MSIAYLDQVAAWEKPPFDLPPQPEVSALRKNPEQLEDAFYKNLAFGTSSHNDWLEVLLIWFC